MHTRDATRFVKWKESFGQRCDARRLIGRVIKSFHRAVIASLSRPKLVFDVRGGRLSRDQLPNEARDDSNDHFPRQMPRYRRVNRSPRKASLTKNIGGRAEKRARETRWAAGRWRRRAKAACPRHRLCPNDFFLLSLSLSLPTVDRDN